MVVFGGKTIDHMSHNDVWVLQNANGLGGTPTWIKLYPTGMAPEGRHLCTSIYDVVNNRMVIFGGHAEPGPFVNDVWMLQNANGLGGTPTWIKLIPTGMAPDGREWHSAVYCPASNRMVIFGGINNLSQSLNDVWMLQNANGLGGTPAWIKLNPTGMRPDPRVGHSSVYDVVNNRMVVFGGSTTDGWSSFVNDAWVLQNANGLGGTPTWIKLIPTGMTLLSEREDHSAVYDAANNRMVVFGGWAQTKELVQKYFNDVWVLNNANGLSASAWVHMEPSGTEPIGRELHTAVYDAVRNRMVLYGGATEGSLLNDIWILINANGI
jgi:hypothetical protein